MPLTAYSGNASDINLLARFLAYEQIQDLESHPPVDCIVICASAILHQAEKLFHALQVAPKLAKTVVLCGGMGHSTPLIWDAVDKSSKYTSLGPSIRGKPEARVLEEIMRKYFKIGCIDTGECKLLIEDNSTNCGANALNSRTLLEASGVLTPKTCIIIQDPTMALRTIASFEKTYANLENPPKFLSCPVFVPEIRFKNPTFEYSVAGIPGFELWEFGRFMELILGEIPRLKDDEEGYGPKGKGFINHIDIPTEVEDAWKRVAIFRSRR
jgi:hypothetical protein